MSFGFSLSDIVLACQLAYTVYDRCFTRANGAGKSKHLRVPPRQEVHVISPHTHPTPSYPTILY